MPLSDWWFPNDEGCPPIIRSIKDFIRERTTAPKDEVSENLREMRGIFGTLTVSDSPGDDNSSNATEDTIGLGSGSTSVEDTLYYTGSPTDYDHRCVPNFGGQDAHASRQFS